MNEWLIEFKKYECMECAALMRAAVIGPIEAGKRRKIVYQESHDPKCSRASHNGEEIESLQKYLPIVILTDEKEKAVADHQG